MKKCPYCAEEVRDEAVVCRHCTRDLPADLTDDELLRNKQKSANGGLIMLGLVALFFLILILANSR